jgi:hypothetical protein
MIRVALIALLENLTRLEVQLVKTAKQDDSATLLVHCVNIAKLESPTPLEVLTLQLVKTAKQGSLAYLDGRAAIASRERIPAVRGRFVLTALTANPVPKAARTVTHVQKDDI